MEMGLWEILGLDEVRRPEPRDGISTLRRGDPREPAGCLLGKLLVGPALTHTHSKGSVLCSPSLFPGVLVHWNLQLYPFLVLLLPS